jgi:hypothetical protein
MNGLREVARPGAEAAPWAGLCVKTSHPLGGRKKQFRALNSFLLSDSLFSSFAFRRPLFSSASIWRSYFSVSLALVVLGFAGKY